MYVYVSSLSHFWNTNKHRNDAFRNCVDAAMDLVSRSAFSSCPVYVRNGCYASETKEKESILFN